ncbi:nucleoside hydrolase [Sulfodiicoccus acidiphilus]|uniref:Nucleoside hydrolase n=1 Tax=Sulfodiicoccus acidiphilus TaxID=1670455 RepID=A0A348B1P9_9CREN|nr:nucleoside hydrolase [Sulfodiicoccus acidiphilus]BBD72101.1 nucleoside hydrolase [Sulfodiicoccus acidiphilus]
MARKFIIDCDTAEDDITSFLLLLRYGAEVVGLTVVEGNISFHQEINNALWAVEFAGVDTPVFVGTERPLIKSFVTVEDVHGKGGIGQERLAPSKAKPSPKHAVDAMIELSERYAGELEVMAISPLTNLAMAILKDKRLVERLKAIYIMGGTIYGRGNITPVAEYNFWVDPDAAKVVLNSGAKLIMLPWEVAVSNAIDESTWARIQSMNTRMARYYVESYKHYREFATKRQGMRGHPHPDVLTTAVAIDRSVATDVRRERVDVENCDCLTRGATVIDYSSPGHVRGYFMGEVKQIGERWKWFTV